MEIGIIASGMSEIQIACQSQREFTGRPQRAINNSLGEGGVNLVSAHGLVMNKTKLLHIIGRPGIQSQIQMPMFIFSSISIVAPTKEFPTVLLLHAVRSLINDVPQMAIQRAVMRSRKIPLSGSFNVCLLEQLPKCSDLLVMIWN